MHAYLNSTRSPILLNSISSFQIPEKFLESPHSNHFIETLINFLAKFLEGTTLLLQFLRPGVQLAEFRVKGGDCRFVQSNNSIQRPLETLPVRKESESDDEVQSDAKQEMRTVKKINNKRRVLSQPLSS